MALIAYTRLRLVWGAFDFQTDSDAPTYTQANTSVQPSTQVLGRKVVLEWNREAFGQDVMQTHVDFANITGGTLDDSWNDADFATCETNLTSWWNAWKSMVPTGIILSHFRWYRFGPGATPPEPAVRELAVNLPGTSSNPPLPWQTSPNITLRTGLRKRWGRMYLPTLSTAHIGGGGNILPADVDTIANATNTLVGNSAGSDFRIVVYSPTYQRAYNVEHVSMDDIFDVQRRRRPDTPGYRKTIP